MKFDFCFKVQLASLTLSEIVVLSQLYVKADLSQRKRFTIIVHYHCFYGLPSKNFKNREKSSS